MSALPDEPEDFLRWARRVDPSARGETFLPRRMYGRYVAELLERAARECGTNAELVRVADEAVDVRPSTTGGVEVVCRSTGTIKADTVCWRRGMRRRRGRRGATQVLRRAGDTSAIRGGDRGLADVGATDRVLIVGTGLTMMDVALSLDEAGHRGSIHAVSRRGLLPQAHRHGNPGLAKLPDPLFSRTFSKVNELLRVIRIEAARAESMGGDWRDVVNAMRSITPMLWAALDERERRRFMDHLLPFWNTHRHRAPPSVAAGIERLISEGRLRVCAARIRAARAVDRGVTVELQPRGPKGSSEGSRWWWTGSSTAPAGCGRAALGGCSDGAAPGQRRGASGVMGMGLDFNDEGRVIGADGRAESRVFLIGPARIGRLWETTAVPELRVQAVELARRLMEVARIGAAEDGLIVETPVSRAREKRLPRT